MTVEDVAKLSPEDAVMPPHCTQHRAQRGLLPASKIRTGFVSSYSSSLILGFSVQKLQTSIK